MQNGKLVVVPPKPAPPPTPRGPDLPIEGPGFGLASKKPASLPPGISMGQFDLPINTPLGATMPGATGAAPPPSQKIPAEVTAVLATVGPGKHTLTDGSVWLKLPDGSIQQVN